MSFLAWCERQIHALSTSTYGGVCRSPGAAGSCRLRTGSCQALTLMLTVPVRLVTQLILQALQRRAHQHATQSTYFY